MHIKPDLPWATQLIVSKQTTTSHKGHQGVNRLTRPGHSRLKKHRTKYQYDDVGNRTNRTGSLGTLTAQTSSYNSNDQLTTDGYDANGNTTNSASNPCRYDFENHLTNFKNRGEVFTYDGDGNRVKNAADAVTTVYLVDSHNPSGYPQVLEELTVSGSTTNLSVAYTYGLSLISQRQANGTVHFYGIDGHGSARFLTDGSGNVTDTYAYDAFGMLIASTGATTNNYLYCIEQYDPALQQYYLRARYMNPATGRFWTMDVDEGDQETPLSLHKYLYGEGDPVDNVDPSGNDIGDVLSVMDINAGLEGSLGISISPQGAFSSGSTCGPDVTVPLMNTMRNVEQTVLDAIKTPAGKVRLRNAAKNVYLHPYDMENGWDIDKLFDLGYLQPVDFGNGSSLGTGLGAYTVQFSYNGPNVYDAGSVNYILWGKMFSLIHRYVYKDPAYSELAAWAEASVFKSLRLDFIDDYAGEARAFVKFGYSGTDPSNSALLLKPMKNNKASPARFLWKWIGLHDEKE
jgi:RHS repeat-associated protein